jgi:uncharacterized protein (DUF58 family)
LFAVGSAFLILCYFFVPDSILIPLGFNILLICAALVDYLIPPSSRQLEFERPLPHPLVVDKSNEITIYSRNATGRALQVRLYDDAPWECYEEIFPITRLIQPGSAADIKYRLTPKFRGVGEFGNLHFWIEGALGLVWKSGFSWAEAKVKMYPALALIEERRLKLRRSSTDYLIRPISRRGEGSEFDSLREYVLGDDPRLINWSASARRGKPIVRQNRMERSQTVFLVLDAGRMMTARIEGRTKLDYALDAALLLAYGALELGDLVGMTVVGQDVLAFIPPAKGPAHFGKMLDAIYDIQPKMQEPRYYLALSDISSKLKRRSIIIIFTDLIDERASVGLKRCVLGLAPRHLPLVVAMSDTDVKGLAEAIPDDPEDLYKKGVASDLLDRRDRLLAGFASMGVLVMDVPPGQMSGAALDKYLDIKARNAL